jgi:hypothetical protein
VRRQTIGFLVVPWLLAMFAFASGCATIAQGKRQTITMESHPAGATVELHDVKGTTPVDLDVPRRAPQEDEMYFSAASRPHHYAHFSLAGYDPIDVEVAYGESGYSTWSSALILGLPGALVDSATGAAVVIETPDHTNVVDSIKVDFLTREVVVE